MQVAARQRMNVEMDDDSLSRAFQGGVTLTFREEETITLDPAQVYYLHVIVCWLKSGVFKRKLQEHNGPEAPLSQ